MEYAFNLGWDELDEDLQERKIDEYIKANIEEYKNNFRSKNNLSDDDEIDDNTILENNDYRTDAEGRISAHFPIYF